MNDLAERLRQIERNPSPDLWDEITSRPVDAAPAERRGLGHRIAAGLVAAIVSIAALAFLVTVFRSEPDRDAVGTASSPLTIRVRTTNDPFDVHFSATFQEEEIDLAGIETPGPDLEYPNSTSAELPVGTPIVIEASDGISVSVFELDPAKGKFVVEDGSCLIPGSLRALPGPDETAFFIYAEGKGWTSGQAFRAETIGEGLTHDSAVDPSSSVEASKLGLATCDVDPSVLVSSSGPSGDQAYLSGTLTTENGCVAVQTGPALSIYVVWPQGYSLAREGGETWLVDDSGNRIAAMGDVIQMGGGITNLADAEPSVQGGVPVACETGGPDAYWFAGTPDLVNSSSPTDSPSPEPASFIPTTRAEGDTTVLPLVLPDGSQVVLAYPQALRLAELGLVPQTLVHSTQSNGCGWEPIIRLGSMNGELYEGSGPVNSLPEGGPAMWKGKGGGSPYYLAYEFGEWSVNVPCDRPDFDGLEAWNEGLQGHVTPDGFLVLDTSPPIVQEGADPDLSYGPGFIFGGSDDPGFLVLTLGTRCDSGTGLQRDDDSAQWCVAIGDGAVEITVYALNTNPEGRQFIDSVVDGLEVRSIDVSH